MLPAPLMLFVASKAGRYTLAAIVAALIIGGGILFFIGVGKEQGKKETTEKVADTMSGNVIADVKSTAASSNDADRKIEAERRRGDDYLASARRLESRNRQLEEELASSRSQVSGVRDENIHAYVVEQLKLRSPSDTTPGYTYAEEREIAVRVTGFPKQQEALAAQRETIANLNGAITSRDKAFGLQAGEIKSLRQANRRLLVAFVDLRNLHPKRKRHIKCLGLWKCADNKLKAPTPEELAKETEVAPSN